MSKIYTDLNTVLTPYATAIKKNASDITSLNGSLATVGFSEEKATALCNLLRGCSYDSDIIPDPDAAITSLWYILQGRDESLIYKISAPIECNADVYIPTGFSINSETDDGYVKDWYIKSSVLFRNNSGYTVFGTPNAESVGYRLAHRANFNDISLRIGNFLVNVSGNNAGIINKTIVTYTASTHTFHLHGVNNGSYVKTGMNARISTSGELYLGGYSAASMVGTIHDFDMHWGTLTEDEIKEYLGVE